VTATPDREANVLEASDIVVRFGGLTALGSVSIDVPRGTAVGLVGPNGAGKTTMFGVCSGLLRPTSGRVRLAGRDVTNASPQARARLGLARTFQQPEVFMGLTVREHLILSYRISRRGWRLWTDIFNLTSQRRANPAEREYVESLLGLLSLTHLADELVDTLPLGTTRLVEVGRALATEPSVVLLDEPLSGLDANEATRLATVLRGIVEQQAISMLLVEHDVATVLSLCSWIFVLDGGELISQGTPDAVRADPAVKAAYLGDEPVPERVPTDDPAAARAGAETGTEAAPR
jgi:ABC-type branched-subunit amino acid transport system ATPase component